MFATSRGRRGFTLVELLVVITIIGILVGIAVPAINAARRYAMRARCTNYQQQLGEAVLHYESVKEGFPGWLNRLKGKNVSWAVMILPYVGRQDVYEQWRDSTSAPTPVRLNQYICPSDGVAPTAPTPDGLSYVANLNVFVDRTNPAVKKVTMSDIRSPDQTPMLSERIDATPKVWGGAAPNQTLITFTWPYSPPATVTVMTLPPTGPGLQSNHGGGSIVVFCSGRVDYLVDDTACNLYEAGPKR